MRGEHFNLEWDGFLIIENESNTWNGIGNLCHLPILLFGGRKEKFKIVISKHSAVRRVMLFYNFISQNSSIKCNAFDSTLIKLFIAHISLHVYYFYHNNILKVNLHQINMYTALLLTYRILPSTLTFVKKYISVILQFDFLLLHNNHEQIRYTNYPFIAFELQVFCYIYVWVYILIG